MSKDMSARNLPNSNTESRLTPNGGGPAAERPGSAPERNETGPPGASRSALRTFFAPGTAAAAETAPGGSGCLPADVDELAAPIVRPGRVAGVEAEVTPAAPAAGVETEASSRPGTVAAGLAIEPAAQPVRRGHRRVVQWVDVPVAVARANPSTPTPDGTAAARR